MSKPVEKVKINKTQETVLQNDNIVNFDILWAGFLISSAVHTCSLPNVGQQNGVLYVCKSTNFNYGTYTFGSVQMWHAPSFAAIVTLTL